MAGRQFAERRAVFHAIHRDQYAAFAVGQRQPQQPPAFADRAGEPGLNANRHRVQIGCDAVQPRAFQHCCHRRSGVVQKLQIAFLTRQRVQRQGAPVGHIARFLRLRQRRGKGLQPFQRLLSRRAVHHKPLLVDALPGQGGNGFSCARMSFGIA